MVRKGILYVISGPSGVGKGTIKDVVLKQIEDVDLSISTTTRQPREGEINGKHYHFVSSEEFHEMAGGNKFLEWAQVYSNLYGTSGDFVRARLEMGRDVLLEIDIQGALQIKRSMPEGVFIFIVPPSYEDLVTRLNCRAKDSRESINERLAAFDHEMQHIKYYDYIVVNDDLAAAVEKVCSIIQAERCRLKNYLWSDMCDSFLNKRLD